ncbi:GntR family transcriptional regulator [Sphingobacterium griseoflavum]|uniref:GntR family transcriptional regulator n=1 Tax=Sphingobacterium griseoflavum TaxID=1474952 RepID=A0ABQ3HVA8_9SPHI|nr:GntR family transcriptional regulator [Sphingobacterium griseoflavum]GHE23412.1 GntR family transcriptional regulator [Sphingobacterium griseoflavum]
MDFNANKAIYLQIAEHVCEHIMLGTWKDEEKIPSVRDLAVQLEVNPNTVMRTYDLLQQKAIIANKRGIGFFLTPDAIKQVKAYRKSVFLADELPQMFRNVYLLEIDLEELQKRYQTFIEENFNQN